MKLAVSIMRYDTTESQFLTADLWKRVREALLKAYTAERDFTGIHAICVMTKRFNNVCLHYHAGCFRAHIRYART